MPKRAARPSTLIGAAIKDSYARLVLRVFTWVITRPERLTATRLHLPWLLSERLARHAYLKYRATTDPRLLGGAVEFFDAAGRASHQSPAIGLEVWNERVLTCVGWSAHLGTGATPVSIRVEPAPRSQKVKLGVKRPDVARAFDNEDLSTSGFTVRCVFDCVPERVSVVAEFQDGSAAKLQSTETVHDAYPDLVAPPADLVPPVVGYLDGIALTTSRRWRITRRPDPARRQLRFGIGEAELATEMGDRASGIASLEESSLQRVALGSDFRIDRLKFSIGAEQGTTGAENFRVVPYRLATPLRDHEVPVHLPLVADAAPDGKFTVRLPSPQVVEISNASCVHGHLIFDSHGQLIVIDRAARPELDFVAGQWDLVHGSYLRLGEAMVKTWGPPTLHLERAASITGRIGFNYFHTLVEYIPRLITLAEHADDPDLPVLVNADLPPASREALEMFVPRERLIPVKRSDVVTVGRLLVPTFHTYHSDSTIEPWWKGAGLHWPTLASFRNQVLSNVDAEFKGSRVFLVRPSDTTNGRGLRNQDQLLQIAAGRGFEPVNPGRLTFREQVEMVQAAEFIVGAGGASFANLLFAHERLTVLGLVSHHLKDFAMFSNIATHAGARFFYATGPSTRQLGRTEYHRDLFHGDFWVTKRAFTKALDEIGA